jgi:YidC/Oxa1 family membrane protein insertase
MWDLLIINPMTNALLWLYGLLGNNFVLAIAVFTIATRILMLPLNLRQQRSMARTQEMQPQIKAIQTKFKDNPQKMQEEFARIGYNPAESLTGCLPLIATMPILFGLFQVLGIVLGTTPQALLELTQRAYSFIDLTALLPIDSQFLWMNLGQPDPYYVLPVLVFVTMFLQTKYSTPPKKKEDESKKDGKNSKGNQKGQADDPTAAMTQSMQYTMPVMFGFFSLSFQAGLSIYFVLSNVIGIGQGLYTRHVMEQERVEREANRQKMPIEIPSDVAEAPSDPGAENGSIRPSSSGNGGAKKSGSSKKKNKR